MMISIILMLVIGCLWDAIAAAASVRTLVPIRGRRGSRPERDE